jgi:hypothetical protein
LYEGVEGVDFGLVWRDDRAVLCTLLVTAWLVGGATEGSNARAAPEAAPLATAAPTLDRVPRVEHWLKAVLHHQPGSVDAAATEVASWSSYALATLKLDLRTLVLLMRKPGTNLYLASVGSRPGVLYTRAEERRLTELACAAGGIVSKDDYCRKIHAFEHLDADLRALAKAAADDHGVGVENYVLERGALLHSDIAMLAPEPTSPLTTSPLTYRQRRAFAVEMSDGQATDVRESSSHWGIARTLLDEVRPTRTDKQPSPGRDEMVRNWYYATAAWMQYSMHYNFEQLHRGVVLFPNDAGILFLAATEHEVYAGAYMQNVMRTVELPPGSTTGIMSEKDELRKSEALFKRALVANPSLVEAHLRLGHVLMLLGRPNDAQSELRQVVMSSTSDLTRYYCELFLAKVEESLGELDAAARGYERASSLFPNAQSPLVALAALARRRGGRRATIMAAEKVFELPQDDEEAWDPWWTYYISQELNADDLIDDLRRPFLSAGEP